MFFSITISVLMALCQVQAQTTVASSSGLIYKCSTDPSAIPAFDNVCPSSLTTTTGTVWPLTGVNLNALYSKAPTSYYSTAASDLTVYCNYVDPSSSMNNFGCRYNAGAATGSGYSAGTVQSAQGTGFNQKCPTIPGNKPQPSPGAYYKKRQNRGTTQLACATTQQGGNNYLTTARYGFSPVTNAQSYSCLYKTDSSAFQCAYDTSGNLITANTDCPSQQCQAAQPYTRRRRGLPQPADKRQTSRERIVARQKEISRSFTSSPAPAEDVTR